MIDELGENSLAKIHPSLSEICAGTRGDGRKPVLAKNSSNRKIFKQSLTALPSIGYAEWKSRLPDSSVPCNTPRIFLRDTHRLLGIDRQLGALQAPAKCHNHSRCLLEFGTRIGRERQIVRISRVSDSELCAETRDLFVKLKEKKT
jgi:hypothetical protein